MKMKTIYQLEPGEEMIRKSDGKIFSFVGLSTIGFGHIIVKDEDGEHRVYGPDFDVVENFLELAQDEPKEEATTYEVNQHTGIQVLISELVIKEGALHSLKKESDGTNKRIEARIRSLEKQVNEIRDSVKWTMEKLDQQ